MVQRTFITTKTEALREYILALKEDPVYQQASDKILFFSDQNDDRAHLHERMSLIREILPDIKIAGVTMPKGKVFEESNKHADMAGYSFLLFERSKMNVYFYDTRNISAEEAGEKLKREVRSLEHPAGIMVFSAGLEREIDHFLDKYSDQGRSQVPVLGAQAGAERRPMLCGVFEGLVSDQGILAIAFRGQGLHMFYNYDCGWRAIGKEMRATSLDGHYRILKIDGENAASIYEKYLGVTADEYFVENVREFPLIVRRGDRQVVRTPSGIGKDGSLSFIARVNEGETIRLSYANPRRLLEETKLYADTMQGFEPQALLLIFCENRVRFLSEQASSDILSYRSFMPQLAWTRGFAAMLMDQEGGGIINASILSIGFREGAQKRQESSQFVMIPEIDVKKGMIPLDQRLAMFLEQTTIELEEMAIQAQSASQAKSDFLSQMSHEIRTPINAILGMNEMILRESEKKSVLQYAENAHLAGMTLLSIINDILDFSKIEAGKMEILPYDYELASLINDLVNLISMRAQEKGLAFEVRVNPATPHVLHGDEIRIRQIITNLLTNAVKYTEKGRVFLNVDFEKSPLEGNILLKVSVQDTGTGIKEADLHKLFEAFDRIDERQARRIEGTGLGINITERLLKLMGSRLQVQSTYGKGSVFSFALGQGVVNQDGIGEYGEALKKVEVKRSLRRQPFTAPEASILVVDDAPMNLAVISGLLKRTKILIDTADSGMECLEKVRGKRYDLIFLDHRMPEMDGIETLQKLKELYAEKVRDLPILCLTANAVAGAREEYLSAGFTDYLTKPVMSEELEAALAKYLPPEKIYFRPEAEENAMPPEKSPVKPAEKTASPSEGAQLPKGLMEIRLIHEERGLQFCGGVGEYLEVLKIFTLSIQENTKALAELYGKGDWETYGIKIHALKSMAKSIGASELSELAKTLEEAAQKRDEAALAAGHEVFLGLYGSLQEPLLAVLKESGMPIESKGQSVERIPGRKVILLVDDDRDFLSMTRGWLKKLYTVDTAESGEEALRYLKKEKPDLVLLDYAMPGMSGPEVLAMIREDPLLEKTPVVFLTGMEDRESADKAERMNPQGYLLK
ncbi:MAG: response regulator, partial [Lachnospiraceae bacterium]|nr:response regulator [Lachnospiraceae bacterium]